MPKARSAPSAVMSWNRRSLIVVQISLFPPEMRLSRRNMKARPAARPQTSEMAIRFAKDIPGFFVSIIPFLTILGDTGPRPALCLSYHKPFPASRKNRPNAAFSFNSHTFKALTAKKHPEEALPGGNTYALNLSSGTPMAVSPEATTDISDRSSPLVTMMAVAVG